MDRTITTLTLIMLSQILNSAEPLCLDTLPAHSTIGFLGDSITQGVTLYFDKTGGRAWQDEMPRDHIEQSGLYHQIVQLFLATRYPGKDLWTVNFGHAGGKASDALRRLSFDVLPNLTDVMVIHFGMNDFGYLDYVHGKASEASQARRMKSYQKNMIELVRRLQGKGCQVAIMSPTIYDEFVEKKVKPGKGAQAELAKYAAWCRELANAKELAYVDLYTPMLLLTREQQRHSPKWSLTKDRIHPDNRRGGDEVMAYYLLEAFGASGVVYEVTLDATGRVLSSRNAEVDVHTNRDGLSFELVEHALPYPLLKTDQGFNQYVPFQSRLNRQILCVKALPEGMYELFIDKVSVGRYTAGDLARGVNLADNSRTPQYQTALGVRDLILFRKTVLEQRIRVIQNNLRFALKGEDGIDWDDPNSILAAMERVRKRSKVRGWKGYLFGVARYTLPRKQQTYAELAGIRRRLAGMPRVYRHRYLLKRVSR
ncbi:MAG: hypothetical protein D6820_06810 [Lentisphaerae bacterium]|nr:MAG: hypothetical protein D6820_06810 [Lentisphaerota bacterium]